MWWLPIGIYSTACEPGCTVPWPNQTASVCQRSCAIRWSVPRTRVLSARAPLKVETAFFPNVISDVPTTAREAVRAAVTCHAQPCRIRCIIRGATVQATSPTSPIRDLEARIISSPAPTPAIIHLRSFSSSANRIMMMPSIAAKGDHGA